MHFGEDLLGEGFLDSGEGGLGLVLVWGSWEGGGDGVLREVDWGGWEAHW